MRWICSTKNRSVVESIQPCVPNAPPCLNVPTDSIRTTPLGVARHRTPEPHPAHEASLHLRHFRDRLLAQYALAAELPLVRAHILLAVVPVLFGVQQLVETVVWIGLDRASPVLVETASLGFWFFAAALWPSCLPVAVAAIEKRCAKQKLFCAFALVGFGFALTVYLPVVARANEGYRSSSTSPCGMISQRHRPAWGLRAPGHTLYIAAVSVLPLLSRDRRVRILGAGCLLSATVN
ncbi:hypothetical protein R5W24_001046 [Gemmata sp. JC717]|uniref:hypothetical protein n=1 Tax=Gemmata algarum TaxID=2975278 RepID=UPI0021BB65C3|nr:hypothetical protein [Gemmata algarum]MDY3551966.1 hypothetical protein [Gemmata algarum]